MRKFAVSAIVFTTGLLAAFDLAQACAQVVQLPTFRTFSVGTTVVVPDRGSMMIGGVDRASFGRNAFGVPGVAGLPGAGRLFGNQAIGGEVQASRLNASATVIDLQEMDRAVRGQAAKHVGAASNPAVARKAAFLAQHIGRNNQADTTRPSAVASSRTDHQQRSFAAMPDAEAEARDAYRLAQNAEAAGQFATARIQYKRAAILARGGLRAEALARLSAITTPLTVTKFPVR